MGLPDIRIACLRVLHSADPFDYTECFEVLEETEDAPDVIVVRHPECEEHTWHTEFERVAPLVAEVHLYTTTCSMKNKEEEEEENDDEEGDEGEVDEVP